MSTDILMPFAYVNVAPAGIPTNVKKDKMLICPKDFILSLYHLNCHLRMLSLITYILLVTMDTNLVAKYGLPRYEKMVTHIYLIEHCVHKVYIQIFLLDNKSHFEITVPYHVLSC